MTVVKLHPLTFILASLTLLDCSNGITLEFVALLAAIGITAELLTHFVIHLNKRKG